ncbi:hypothetical protein QWJ34_05285 [Saccharibacillus sp. CPCC 101409]|uniref:hypothetical protein n=1 Tax=Saccharibacillus sp. CPCC 101409 TaxID=3058041 RepID=UPI0026715920|nr:hypothetical protein [Saccharibacillus sp. CPCC 101409]MDO3409169.1 hypothetical protein [Saccharibacillus sp. CPCC 101409]
MPQFLEWLFSHFYIVLIIAGALFSVFGKANAGKKNGGGEPFGGGGAGPNRRTLQGGPGQSRRLPGSPGADQPGQSPFSGAPLRSGEPDGDGRERMTLDQASRQMNTEIDRRLREQRSQRRRSGSVEDAAREIERAAAGERQPQPPKAPKASKPARDSRKHSEPAAASAASAWPKATAEELRKGILWAEILGEPRARKRYSSGRR